MLENTPQPAPFARRIGPSRPARVCVVDDDLDTAQVARAVLHNAGYEVACYRDGQRALQCLHEHAADLILLDLRMPGMDGWQFRVAQRADDALSSIPVVIMTGDRSPQATAIDAASVLRKPFDSAALITTVERVLRESKHRRFTASLEETSRLALLGAGAAGVGHEVNNPLACAMANLALMAESLPSFRAELVTLEATGGQSADPTASERLEIMEKQLHESRTELERVRLIVRNLQHLCGDADRERTRLDLNQLVETSVAMARSQLRDRAPISCAYGEVPEISGNAARLMQVFRHLLINAAQTIAPGHSRENWIRIITRAEIGHAIIEITDSGAVVSDVMKSHVFEPLFTASRDGSATSLGLPICRDIVEEHGGQLEVSSTPERGNRTTVRLPCDVGSPSIALASSDPAAQTVIDMVGTTQATGMMNVTSMTHMAADEPTLLRLWIVDDEPAMTRILARVLADEYVVTISESPTDVLQRLHTGERFDVMLCDVMMPEMTGVDLATRIEAGWPGLAQPIVFMSGGALSPRLNAYLTTPGRRLIEKPFALETLRQVIRDAVPTGAAEVARAAMTRQ